MQTQGHQAAVDRDELARVLRLLAALELGELSLRREEAVDLLADLAKTQKKLEDLPTRATSSGRVLSARKALRHGVIGERAKATSRSRESHAEQSHSRTA